MEMQEFDPEFPTTILWRIENIGSWNLDTHDRQIFSPEFELNDLAMVWQLSFFSKDLEEFDVGLTPTDSIDYNRYLQSSLRCDWSLLDKNGTTLLKRVVECRPNWKQTHYMFSHHDSGNIILHKKSIFTANGNLTVRLRIRDITNHSAPMEYVSMVTRLLEKSPKESFVWRIERFRTFQLKNEAATTVNFKGNVFRLRVFLRGESLEDADLNFDIATENANLKSLKAKISFFNNHKRCVQKKREYSSTESKQTWVVSKLVTRREILEDPSDWLRGDDLVFLCEFEYDLRSYTHSYVGKSYSGPMELMGDFGNSDAAREIKELKQCPKSITSSISNEKVHTSLSWNLSDDRGVSRTAIGNDFFSAYSKHILCDFELFSGKASFHVHKFVLSARSRFFRALFKKESDSKFLQVPDLDLDTLGRFVTFLYAGTANDLHWWSAARLYDAAHMYDVPSLVLECSNALRSNIALSNVCEVLELADKYEDRELMSDVHDFIQEHFDEVVLSEEWDKFLERSCLAGKTMKEIYKRRNAFVHSLYV